MTSPGHLPTPQTSAAAGLTLLHRLRSVVLRNPHIGVDHLRRLTSPHGDGTAPGLDVDVRILLAEACQQDRDIQAAREAAYLAARAAASQPGDWRRLAMAAGVDADSAVLAGSLEAAVACDTYFSIGSGGEPTDECRAVLAAALRAVVAHHRTDCAEGYRRLSAVQGIHLRRHGPRNPIAVMISDGLTAMQDGCRRRCRCVVGIPPPLPGGVLHPYADIPHPNYLAYRIGFQLPAHPKGPTSPCPTTQH